MINGIIEHFRKRVSHYAAGFVIDIKLKIIDDTTPDFVFCEAQ